MFLVVPASEILLKTIFVADAEKAQDANPGSLIVKAVLPCDSARRKDRITDTTASRKVGQ
jgi:hypothetical protein